MYSWAIHGMVKRMPMSVEAALVYSLMHSLHLINWMKFIQQQAYYALRQRAVNEKYLLPKFCILVSTREGITEEGPTFRSAQLPSLGCFFLEKHSPCLFVLLFLSLFPPSCISLISQNFQMKRPVTRTPPQSDVFLPRLPWSQAVVTALPLPLDAAAADKEGRRQANR